MFTALFLVISLLGSIAPGIATAQDAGTPAPVVTEEPAAQPAQTAEQPAAEQPAPEAPVEQPAQEAPPVEPAAEQPAEEAAPAEAVVEQPVDETSTVMTEVAPEPVEVPAAPVSCQVAEGVSPWIASDLADYPPGAWVSLSGGNWASGQTVEIFVDDDGVADTVMGEWSHYATVTADGSGAFVYGFSLPEWFVADYYVTATGECSTASTAFTDATNTATVLALTSGSNPSASGQPLTFTATVSGTGKNAVDPGNVGSVTFKDGSTAICTAAPLTNNKATCTTSSLSQGNHSITAVYSGPGGSDGFNASTSNTVSHTVTVAKQNQTITFPSLTNKTYGDPAFSASATASSGLTVSFTASGACTLNGATVTITGAGTCSITASQAGNDSYHAATSVERSFVIAPKALTISGLSVSNRSYDGTSEATITGTPSLVGVVGSDNVTVSGTPVGTFNDASASNGKTVTVTGLSLTGSSAGNYTLTPLTLTADVTAAKVTVTANDQTITFGEQVPALTFTSRPELPVSNFTGAVAVEDDFASNAGDYAIVQGTLQLVNPNYTLAFEPGILKVNKASQAITGISVPEDPKVDGAHEPTATGGGSGNAVTFGASGACSFADGTVTFDAAGECTVTADQAGNDNYHAAPQVEQSFTIGKGTAEITLDGLRHTYDGTPKFATATNSKGLVVTFTYAQGENAVEEPVNAGEYTVTATIEDANYEGSITGTLTIEQAKVNVTIANQTMVYNGTSPELTFGNSARLPAGDFSGGLKIDGDPASGVGFYPIVPDGLAVTNGNYKLGTVTDGTLEVTPAPVILVIDTDSLSQTYTGTALEIGFQTDPAGLEGSIALEYRLNGVGDAIDPVNAGSYSVTARITDANYELDFEGTRLTIEKQAVTVFVSDPAPTYDGARKDASVSGAPDGVQVELAYSRDGEIVADPIGAGTYDVAATVKDANYEGTATGTLTIKQAEVTIKIEDKTKIYGAEDPAFTSSVTDGNLAGNDTASGKFTREAGEDVREGGYAITGGDLSLGNNYKLTVNPGILTITKAEQKIGFEAIGPKTYGDSSVTISVNASSGLDVSFAAKDGSACTVSGTTVTLTGAGSCTVVASQAGDGNYNAAPDAEQTFAIERKVVTPVLGDLTHTYDGKAKEATVKLPDGVTGTVTITYNGLPTAPVSAGSYPVEAKLEGANHGGSVKGTLEIKKASWTVKGFYQPIDMGGAVNTAKGGSTVPVKFEVFQGNTEITDVSQVTVKIVRLSSCAAAGGDEVTLEQTTTGGTSLRYEGGQFVYNFKTDKAAGTCYKLTVEATSANLNATVNGSQEAYIKTK